MDKEVTDPNDSELLETAAPEDNKFAAPLTDREIAIAEGRDPDELTEAAPLADEPEPEVVEEVEPAAEPVVEEAVAPPAPWFNDADVSYAADRGFSRYEMQRFRDKAEFDNAIWAAERLSAKAPKTEPAPVPAKEPEYVDAPLGADGKVNLAYYEKHEYDEATMALAKAFRAQQDKDSELSQKFSTVEKQLEDERKRSIEAEEMRQVNALHDVMDAIRPDFYGKSADEHGSIITLGPAEVARRKQLLEEIDWSMRRIATEQQRAGLPIAFPSAAHLVKQAESRIFSAELLKLEQAKQAAAVKAQSRNIRPAAGSAGAGHARKSVARIQSDDPAELANDPDLIAAWRVAEGN